MNCEYCHEELTETSYDLYVCENSDCEYLELEGERYELDLSREAIAREKADLWYDMVQEGELC